MKYNLLINVIFIILKASFIKGDSGCEEEKKNFLLVFNLVFTEKTLISKTVSQEFQKDHQKTISICDNNKIIDFSQSTGEYETFDFFIFNSTESSDEKNLELENMFKDITILKSINIAHASNFGLTSINNMFSGCSNLESITAGNLEDAKISITDADSVFQGCNNLREIIFTSNFIFTNITNIFSGLDKDAKLGKIDLYDISLTTSNIKNYSDIVGKDFACKEDCILLINTATVSFVNFTNANLFVCNNVSQFILTDVSCDLYYEFENNECVFNPGYRTYKAVFIIFLILFFVVFFACISVILCLCGCQMKYCCSPDCCGECCGGCCLNCCGGCCQNCCRDCFQF